MLPRSIEWPTIAVALADIAGLVALVAWGDRLPAWAVVLLLAVLAALYNSIQHEVIHGHPTPWRRVNDAMASTPVGLVYPFERYRETHLAHHDDELLTEPGIDPESFYVTASEWEASSAWRRGTTVALQTLLGRMVLGPPVYAFRFWRSNLRAVRRDAAVRRSVAVHLARAAVVVAVVWAAPIALWTYVLGAVWFGWSLSLVRSFAEHRAGPAGLRTAVVDAGPVASLLFLNNNLHVTHHERPGLAWYRLPAAYAASDHGDRAERGAGRYGSYATIVWRHLVRPLWHPVHPGSAPGGAQARAYAPDELGGGSWGRSTSR